MNVPTLFYDAASRTAALVTKVKRRRQAKAVRFPTPHAALDWCIANRAGFVFIPSPPVRNN